MVVVNPCGPHHCTRCFGLVQASNTNSRGASKTRVKISSRSLALAAALVLALLAGMLFLLFLLLAKVGVQTIETLLPETAVVFHPVRDILQRIGFQPAGPPLGFAPARDQTRALQYFKVFGNRRQAHAEGLSQLVDRSLA